MKIAVITPFYAPSIGGMQETLRVCSEYMASQSCEVRVYTSRRLRMDELPLISFRRSKTLPAYEVMQGVKVHRFECGGFLDAFYGFAYAVSYKLCRPLAPRFYDADRKSVV